jgi:hypothetical protein
MGRNEPMEIHFLVRGYGTGNEIMMMNVKILKQQISLS